MHYCRFSFMISYFKTELAKNNFKINTESEGLGVKQFSFSRESDGVNGSLYAQNQDKNASGPAHYAMLTVNLAAESD